MQKKRRINLPKQCRPWSQCLPFSSGYSLRWALRWAFTFIANHSERTRKTMDMMFPNSNLKRCLEDLGQIPPTKRSIMWMKGMTSTFEIGTDMDSALEMAWFYSIFSPFLHLVDDVVGCLCVADDKLLMKSPLWTLWDNERAWMWLFDLEKSNVSALIYWILIALNPCTNQYIILLWRYLTILAFFSFFGVRHLFGVFNCSLTEFVLYHVFTRISIIRAGHAWQI